MKTGSLLILIPSLLKVNTAEYKYGDAVLLDIVMPENSGYETLIELKRLNPDLPVLMTSGLYSNKLIENVKLAEASDFIEKPYSAIQLSRKINTLFKY